MKKLAPYGTDGQLLLTANFKVTWHRNWDKIKKSGPTSFRYCPLIKESVITCQPPSLLGEEITFENGRFSEFQGLVTFTFTLDRVILHTVMHHSSTSTYTPNFIEIEETYCGRMDRRTVYMLLGRLRGVYLKILHSHSTRPIHQFHSLYTSL